MPSVVSPRASAIGFICVPLIVGSGVDLVGAQPVTRVLSSSVSQTKPVNLAARATITASGQYNDSYAPRNVANGCIPTQGSRDDLGKAWCLPQEIASDAWISFAWKAPVTVASIVYWGRTAFLDNENFSSCEIRIDRDTEPIASIDLRPGPHPQPIELPTPVKVRELTLRFPTNYGGPNPGASEIGLFAKLPCAAELELYVLNIESKGAHVLKRVARGEFGFESLLLTQRHPLNSSHVYTYHQEGLQPGGGIWLADFSAGEPRMRRILDSSKGEILDANLHYDGRTILFSWKRTMEDFFQLYTMGIEGSNLNQITDHPSNNFNACWLPDGGIVFLSDRKPAFAYCWRTTTPILWRCDGDGANQTRLSANYLNDFTPSVLASGRIVYSRWEYVDRPAIPIQGLWTINPDGTRLEGLFGNRALSPATFMDAREIPDSNGKILCILTAHNGPCRGAVGIIDSALGANTQQAIRNLTPEVDIGKVDAGNGNRIRGPYLNPFPLDDRYFLVSKSGTIELRDYGGKTAITLIRGRNGMGFYCPQPVRTRNREKLFASQLDPNCPDAENDQATVMMQDVYNGLGAAVPRGSIKKLAVVQEVEKPVGISPDLRAFGFQFPVVSCGSTYAPKKIWGYATVEPDGSASFKVPARQPIYFLPLDEQGRAVQRMRTFTHLMPGEVQACVGCHADRNAVAPNIGSQAAAMLRPPQKLETPEWGMHGFSYPHIVQPIWDKHCVECHGQDKTVVPPELTADKTDFFNVSYEHLVRKGTQSEKWWPGGFGGQFNYNKYTSWIPTYNGQEANILEIAPGRWGAKASPLAKIVAEGHPDEQGKKRVNLSDTEKRRIYAWLDLNCPYYGTSDSNHRQLRGCRQQLPADFVGMMNEIGRRRCASCHENAGKDENWVYTLPGSFYIRIDNPERNGFLTSPLAKAAGGSEKCGRAVFENTNDPDYRRVVESFFKLQTQLKSRPRFDMMSLEDQKVTSNQSDCIVEPDGTKF